MATDLDSSAVVKPAVQERESAALRRHLRRRRPLVSSALARRCCAALALLVSGVGGLDLGPTLGPTLFSRHPGLEAFGAVLAAVGLNP